MIFSEIYSLYYKAVSRILALSVEGKLTEKDMYALARENAFPESPMTIVPALKNQEWPLLSGDLHTPLAKAPRLPLTTLEKRWLKTVLSDPRAFLFAPEMAGLEEIEPLFDPKDIVYFDRYTDGDPFTDQDYRDRFRTIWKALKEKKLLHLEFLSSKGNTISGTYLPVKLEYSTWMTSSVSLPFGRAVFTPSAPAASQRQKRKAPHPVNPFPLNFSRNGLASSSSPMKEMPSSGCSCSFPIIKKKRKNWTKNA